jgi:hypothetical protein
MKKLWLKSKNFEEIVSLVVLSMGWVLKVCWDGITKIKKIDKY